jgi:hypothetical protein
MKRVCAWCTTELGNSGVCSDVDCPITHGICRSCAQNLLFQMGVELRKYLDSLPVPIVVVDPEGTIKTANDKTQKMLGKDLLAIEGYKGGVVFECCFARLPEGCGNTMHCSACTIRRAVMGTFATGKSNARIPAYLNQENSEGVREIRLLISTEKVGDVVLLRIDEVKGR